MLKAQSGPGGRRPANGAPGASARPPAGRNRSVKPPLHTSPAFEGIYNNARMTHFLTAVVGSTCDVRVKNGSVYEGIFKTLSSRCELAVDAVHKHCDEDGSLPRREEITDTMIFSPADVVTMTCRDVDLNYATRDTFTDNAISSSRVNGEHKEKVLQRWDGGDSNGENFDLEGDTSNGWDANEMFRFNEETYGVKSTYDSSLSMYTTPLERSGTEGFKQREARAARLANEIEASVQYRHRVALENDDGRSEEDKYSAVLRDGGGRESPREKERGRDSPSNVSREAKYIPLPQRVRDMGGPGGGGRERGSRVSGGFTPSRPAPSGSSSRPPASSPGPQSSPSERSSPMTNRATFSPNTPSPRPSEASTYGSPSSPTTPTTHTHPHPTVPHSHSLPHSLSDAARPVNGVSSRTSPKAQRPLQTNRASRTSTTHPSTTASRSPKLDGPSQDSSSPSAPYIDAMAKQKALGPAPLFPVDVNEILNSAAKDKPMESPSSTDETKIKVPSAQQRSQLEELRKFGKEFRLQPSPSSPSSASGPEPPGAVQPGSTKSTPEPPSPVTEPKPSLSPNLPQNLTPSPQPQHPASASPAEDPSKEKESPPTGSLSHSDRQTVATPQPARTPGAEEARTEATVEGVTDQVKKSTLNPNAKEFNPNKPPLTLSKPSTAPTPPRPTPPSPSVVLQHPPGQNAIYNPPYLSYVSQLHSVQAPPLYQYTMSTVNQGKFPRPPKGPVLPRSDHGSSAPTMLQAAASGASLVASPYPQSYLQYNPQQYSQQQVIQTMTPYGQPMYSVLQSGARMLGQSGCHPQTLGPPTGPQFPGQAEGPQGPQQGLYAPQTFPHHSGPVHPPQPSSTPTGNQPPPQHTTPSPGQTPQSGPQSLYHSGPLPAPTPPNLPPGHSSPQASYTLQGYGLHGHPPMTHPYTSLGQLAQAHHSGSHGPVVMLHAAPPQAGPGSAPQHPQHGPQQGPPQHFPFLGPSPAVQVQSHPTQQIPFHPPGN
ncbi:ataxin-2-like protein isoform X2 [Hoplias malabaricus]|uniref:ataxin-2-like protein isoform X2 n=1 Tax=Hoplias malabaricus TaxID=27720 RepID=UPI0034620625